MKSVLRCFEVVSGLKVNFHKTGVIGINVENRFLDTSYLFLNCKCDSLPFKYLGLPIGANPKKMSMWQPIVDLLVKRLSSWKQRHLSFGGRITLIHSFLNNIPIYYLSFIKMRKKSAENCYSNSEELFVGWV